AAIALFVAALGAFVFARELGRSETASLVAAVGWAFSACVVLYTQTAMGFATALLPLLLAGVRRRSFALLVAALALTALAGHPESLFLNVLTGAAYGVFELVRRRERTLRTIGIAAAAGVVALLVCAVAILPLVEAIPQSVEYRLKRDAPWLEPSGAQSMAVLATNVFPHLHVRPWLKPHLGLVPAETAAVGSLVLALAIFAAWRVRSAETWFFTALAMMGIAIGTEWPPLMRALRAVPLMDVTQMQRLVFAAALALAILAAFGVDAIARRGARATLATVLLLLCIGMFLLSRSVVLGAPSYGKWRVAAELVFLAAAVVRPRAAVLLALVFAQRALSEIDTFSTFPVAAVEKRVAAFAPMAEAREPFRVVGRGAALPPATNIHYRLEDPRGYEALTFLPLFVTEPLWCGRGNDVWFNRVDDLTRPFLSFLNVRFALQRDGEDVPPGWHRVASRDGLSLLENERVLDRVFVPKRVAMTDMAAEEMVRRMEEASDFRDVAWIASNDPGVRENGPGSIALRAYSRGGRYSFAADMQNDGWVVVSDSAWKGWRAWIDGRATEVGRANAAFLAVHVPRGKHDVRLEYRPASFVIGGWISVVASVAYLLYVLYVDRRRVAH
ncbi:MAG TPA: YfhO family protein, partial [Thermoanaerobaculia bacterium]|nr:YfhO family protein [Thermoanaerobaculia bacterium]